MSDKTPAPSHHAAPQESAIPLIGGIFDAAMMAANWRAFINRLADVLLDHGILLLLQKVGREVFRAHSPEEFEPMHDKPQERIRLRIDLSRSVDADTLQMTSDDGDVDAWRPVKSALADEAAKDPLPEVPRLHESPSFAREHERVVGVQVGVAPREFLSQSGGFAAGPRGK